MSNATWLVAALIGVFALALVWWLSRREKPKAWIQETLCPNCGWRGQTSRYAGRCPRCSTPIGDQKAKLR